MLKLLTIESINGDTSKAGSKVLNTQFMSEVKTYSTTKARFRFTSKPDDRRGGGDWYVVSESRTTITTAMNQSFNAVGITLNVHPENSASNSAVAALFNVAEIVMVYPNSTPNTALSWIVVNEKGWKHRKYLVAHKMVDVAAISLTGTTTTTTTTTS